MAERTIICEDCGAEYATKRTNTKRCRLCATLRYALWIGGRESTCIGCDRNYLPLSSEKFAVCADCYPKAESAKVVGKCAFCDQDTDQLIHEEVAVCKSCAQTPEKRELFIKALLKKQAARRAA